MEAEKKEKTYTITEITEMCGLTRASVLKRARRFGFTRYCRYVLKKTLWGNYIKEFTFTESQVRQMGCDHLISKKPKCNTQEETIAANTLEELKRQHPLVTNEKCFKKSWWPEVVPSVLSEDEE